MKGEANWLRVFENRVLREILGTGREQVKGLEVNCVVRSGIICAAHPVVRGWSSGQMNGDEMGWAGRVARSWGGEVHKMFGGGNRQVVGYCECGYERSYSTKCGEYLDWLRKC